MSTFVLKRNYELQLPTSFVDIDRDEMEYVDGGTWNAQIFVNNVWGKISSSGTSRALAYAGITMGVVFSWAKYSFTVAAATIGYQAAKIATIIGGVIAGIVAGSGAAYFI